MNCDKDYLKKNAEKTSKGIVNLSLNAVVNKTSTKIAGEISNRINYSISREIFY